METFGLAVAELDGRRRGQEACAERDVSSTQLGRTDECDSIGVRANHFAAVRVESLIDARPCNLGIDSIGTGGVSGQSWGGGSWGLASRS